MVQTTGRAQTKVCARPVFMRSFCAPYFYAALFCTLSVFVRPRPLRADIFVVKAAYLFGVGGYLLQRAGAFVGAYNVAAGQGRPFCMDFFAHAHIMPLAGARYTPLNPQYVPISRTTCRARFARLIPNRSNTNMSLNAYRKAGGENTDLRERLFRIQGKAAGKPPYYQGLERSRWGRYGRPEAGSLYSVGCHAHANGAAQNLRGAVL